MIGNIKDISGMKGEGLMMMIRKVRYAEQVRPVEPAEAQLGRQTNA
jgi:hypothetical protein